MKTLFFKPLYMVILPPLTEDFFVPFLIRIYTYAQIHTHILYIYM